MIIGLAGAAGAGKSTAAGHLHDTFGFARVRFAAPLKAMCRAYLVTIGIKSDEIERMIEGDLKEVPSEAFCGKTPRYVMQTLGTEFGRQLIGLDLWTNAWKIAAEEALKTHKGVVAEDCRFDDEIAAVWSMGGSVVRIKRPGLSPIVTADHVSEQHQPFVNTVIWNDGPMDIFMTRIEGFVELREAWSLDESPWT